MDILFNFLDEKFHFPSNSSDERKRRKNKRISLEDSLILRSLDLIKQYKIYDDGLPSPSFKTLGSVVWFNLMDQQQKLLKIYTDNLKNEEYKDKSINEKAIEDSQNYRFELIHDLNYNEASHLYDELTLLSEVINEFKMNIEKIHFINDEEKD